MRKKRKMTQAKGLGIVCKEAKSDKLSSISLLIDRVKIAYWFLFLFDFSLFWPSLRAKEGRTHSLKFLNNWI